MRIEGQPWLILYGWALAGCGDGEVVTGTSATGVAVATGSAQREAAPIISAPPSAVLSGSSAQACSPLGGDQATTAEIEKWAATQTGNDKIPGSQLIKSKCKDIDILNVSNGFVSRMWFFRNGAVIGGSSGTDNGGDSCYGEQAPFPCK